MAKGSAYVDNMAPYSSLSRLSAMADDNAGSVSVLGLNTIVERDHPKPNVYRTYFQKSGQTNTLTDGGDLYTGLDRYGNTTSDSGQAMV